MVIPPEADPDTITKAELVAIARQQGVVVGAREERAISEIAADFHEGPRHLDRKFAAATQPEHGIDAQLEWQAGFDPANPQAAAGVADGERDRIDFYSKQTFIHISSGDHIATVTPATRGIDGRNVRGEVIPATPGQGLPVTIDPSILKLPGGQLIAQRDGFLDVRPDQIRIEPVLVVSGTVDFSTGNIDFDGDVVIREDIRDKFSVRATKSVTVEGLVDACLIECGGDLIARSGIAGRGDARIGVAGDARVRYLHQVKGFVEGTLRFATEILRSDIWVGEDLIAPTGAMIGGNIRVAGGVRIAELGSGSDTPTRLSVGGTAPTDSKLGRQQRDLAKDATRAAKLRRELEMLRTSGGALGHVSADRMTELSFEIYETDRATEALYERSDGEHDHADAISHLTIRVMKMIHARVAISIAGKPAFFGHAARGPIEIWLEGGTLMSRHGDGQAHPLETLPGVELRTAA